MLLRTLLASAALACSTAVHATDFPTKVVRIVVPFAPGGNGDNLTRLFAKELAAKWNQTVIVENKPGGGATIGPAQVARAPADGYTLLVGSVGMATNQYLFKKMPYDAKAIAPLALVAQGPNVLYVNPSLPVKNVGELIDYAKANPGKISFASSGVGTSPHLAAELFAYRAGVKILHVPYKGANPAANDLVGGQVNAFFSVLNLMPYAKDGRLRALAVTSDRRIEQAPELPTISEAGGPTGVISGTWWGFFAPASLPGDVKAKIEQGLREVASDKRMQDAIAGLELSPVFLDSQAFGSLITAEEKRWSDVIRSQNISIE